MSSKYTLLDLLHVQTAVMLSSGCLLSKRGYLEFVVAILRDCRPLKSMESRKEQICIFLYSFKDSKANTILLCQ